MSEIIKEKINVDGSTVDFYKYIQDGLTTYEIDTSKCGPPEPMVNAMCGLKLLDQDSQLIMINHKAPGGLFPKVEQEFSYEIIETQNAFTKIVFRKKFNSPNTTDFTSNSCSG